MLCSRHTAQFRLTFQGTSRVLSAVFKNFARMATIAGTTGCVTRSLSLKTLPAPRQPSPCPILGRRPHPMLHLDARQCCGIRPRRLQSCAILRCASSAFELSVNFVTCIRNPNGYPDSMLSPGQKLSHLALGLSLVATSSRTRLSTSSLKFFALPDQAKSSCSLPFAAVAETAYWCTPVRDRIQQRMADPVQQPKSRRKCCQSTDGALQNPYPEDRACVAGLCFRRQKMHQLFPTYSKNPN